MPAVFQGFRELPHLRLRRRRHLLTSACMRCRFRERAETANGRDCVELTITTQSLVGQERGRTIPLADELSVRMLQCTCGVGASVE
jgi:hypothetical protein